MTILKGKVQLPAYTTKYDKWVFLAVVPLQIVICSALILGPKYFTDFTIFITATLTYFAVMFGVFQVCGSLALWFLRRYPEVKDTAKRIIISTITYMVITFLSITPLLYIFSKIPLLDYKMTSLTHFGVALTCALGNIIITAVFEGIAAFERWKETVVESEELKKENLKSQLQSLKNQINPHFLFNSLNSLSSLIADDPQKAEVFLDEMSKVYRYLLRNNEDHLIPLNMELQFINSYYHLLRTRYSEGIELVVDAPEKCSQYLLPPLTIQILIENAVKHNIILKEQPLRIEIKCISNTQLMVKNNLQRKPVKVISHRLGLENIAAKYQLLNEDDIVVSEDEKEFAVTVPLIPNKQS